MIEEINFLETAPEGNKIYSKGDRIICLKPFEVMVGDFYRQFGYLVGRNNKEIFSTPRLVEGEDFGYKFVQTTPHVVRGIVFVNKETERPEESAVETIVSQIERAYISEESDLV